MTFDQILATVKELEEIRAEKDKIDQQAAAMRQELWRAEQFLIDAFNEYLVMPDNHSAIKNIQFIEKLIDIIEKERNGARNQSN